MSQKSLTLAISIIMILSGSLIVTIAGGHPGIMEEDPTRETRSTLTVGPGQTYMTIQSAINAASIGDSIFIMNGTYNERLTMNKALNIEGESIDGVIVDGGWIGDVFVVLATDFTITNMSLRRSGDHFNYGLRVGHWHNASVTPSDFTIENVIVSQNYYGLAIYDSKEGSIIGVRSSFNNETGIHIEESPDMTVLDCTVYGNDAGISVGMSNNVLIDGCNSSNNRGGGLGTGDGSNVVIRNSLSLRNQGGVYVAGHGNTVFNCTIAHNLWSGIEIWSSSFDNVILNNRIINNSHVNHTENIYLGWKSHDNLIVGNLIKESPRYGIAYKESGTKYSYDNLIYYNNFINNGRNGNQGWDTTGNTNIYNLSKRGNYWSDWTSPDTDSDGRVDTPYTLAGGANAKDHFPSTTILTTPWILPTNPPKTAVSGQLYEHQFIAVDPNGYPGDLEWSIAGPSWLKMTDDHVLTGIPDVREEEIPVLIQVWDKDRERMSYMLELKVISDNTLPIITASGDVEFEQYEDAHINFTVSDEDDLESFEYEISMVSSLSDGIESIQKQLPYHEFVESENWGHTAVTSNPGYLDVWFDLSDQNLWMTETGMKETMTFELVVKVTDVMGGIRLKTITVILNNVDDPMTLEVTDTGDCAVGDTFVCQFGAIDIDDPVEDISWNIEISNGFLIVDMDEMMVYGNPNLEDIGTCYVNIIAESLGNPTLSKNISFEVTMADTELDSEEFTFDEDGSYSNHTIDSLFGLDVPDDALFDVEGNDHIDISLKDDGSIEIIPDKDWVGTEEVTIKLTINDILLTKTIEITIENVNDVPADGVITLPDQVTHGRSFILKASADDPDLLYGDILNFTWTLDTGDILGYGPELSLTLEEGDHRIILIITDSEGESIEVLKDISVSSSDEQTHPNLMIPILVAIVAMIILAITFGIIIRRRSSRDRETSDPTMTLNSPGRPMKGPASGSERLDLSIDDNLDSIQGLRMGSLNTNSISDHRAGYSDDLDPIMKDIDSQLMEGTRPSDLMPPERELRRMLRDSKDQGEISGKTYKIALDILRGKDEE